MKSLHMQMLLASGLGTCSTLVLALATAQEVVVIVNPASPTISMTVDQVQQIYLGKTTTLPAGDTASAVDLPDGSPLRDDFYQKAAGRSRAQVKAVWIRLLFSGKNVPPKALGTSADVKQFVASHPSGIGYIEKSAADASVKIVLTIP